MVDRHEAIEAKILTRLRDMECVTTRGTIRHETCDIARSIAYTILCHHIPAGTRAWMLSPRRGEKAKAYVTAAVCMAAMASSHAGGLR